jgi:hypothetical protein
MGTFLDIRRLLPKPFIFQSNNMDGMCFIRNYPQYREEDIVPEKNKPARKHSGSKNAGWER